MATYYVTSNYGNQYYTIGNTTSNGYYTYSSSNSTTWGYGYKNVQWYKNKEVKHLLQKERGW